MEKTSQKQQNPKTLTLSDLLLLSLPLTGASSLNHSRPIKPQSPQTPITTPLFPSLNPNPKTLIPLNYPTIISGTLTLATSSHSNTLLFSDESSIVPCDILGLEFQALGSKLHVTAWNFIPFEKTGFLEIISWEFAGFRNPDGYFLSIGGSDSSTICDLKARFCVRGVLQSVSPVSVVPCSMGPNCESTNVRGFLANMLVCGCKLCNTKEPVMGSSKNHSFITPVIVYFCGSKAASSHPVIVKLVGSVVSLSRLKKKLIFIGEEQSQLMYVTSENSLLSVPNLLEKWGVISKNVVKGKGECGSYTGTITGIYMKGMVVELDQKVFLVVTDQLIVLPHSVRVGAIVSIRNVHFVNPNFSWTRILILGACFKTSVCLESFSPFETGCCMYSRTQSLLGNFLDSLVYSARLWVLLLVSSFRKKFVGILSEQEILGSKHLMWTVARCQKKGLVQSFATSHLPSSVFRSRQGLFREYCKHDSCGCDKEPNNVQLKLVAPISDVITHCNATWIKKKLEQGADSELTYDCDQSSRFLCEGVYYSQKCRNILQSNEIGVTLLGWIKVSPFSGRLQLTDSTGSIDIFIPGLNSTLAVNKIYEVNDFTLVREGTPEHRNHSEVLSNVSFSCRSIFTGVRCKSAVEVEMYVLYHFRDAKLLNHPSNPIAKDNENFVELQSGIFHMLLVTHKYLFKQKFQGEQVIPNGSSVFAEVLLLPWDLDIIGKDKHCNPTNLSAELLKESVGEYSNEFYPDFVPSKRLKTNQGSSGEHLSSCLSSSPEIPCSVTFRGIKNQGLMTSATMCSSKSSVNVSSGKNLQAQKLLLEFKSESIWKYQVLKIGSYFIIKHHKEDMLCAPNTISHANSSKVIVSSTTNLWSFSFSSNRVHLDGNVCDALGPVNLTDKLFAKSNNDFPQLQPDVTVHLSNHDLDFLKHNLKELDESFMKPLVSFEEVSKFSLMTGSVKSPEYLPISYQLPEGNLISLHGKVLSVHNCGYNAYSSLRSDFCRVQISNVAKRFCIHVLVDHHPIRIFGSSSSYAYPVGFGPGCTADFHRILVTSGRNKLIMTPSSYIEIKSIILTAEEQCDKGNKNSVQSDLCSAVSLDNISSILISEVMQHADCKSVQFHCRIVAICVLLLEKNRKAVYPQTSGHPRIDVLHIPLAGFVMDDGSSTSCFWANNEMAVTLLRLNENFPHEMIRKPRGTNDIKKEGDTNTIIHYVGNIVKKHGVVTVRNYGSLYDSTNQDLTFSVSSNAVFNDSDEEFLKCVILNACFGTGWTIIGNLMDSHAVRKLEKRLAEMDMTMHPMQNIWIQEVHHINPLAESRRVMQELMS